LNDVCFSVLYSFSLAVASALSSAGFLSPPCKLSSLSVSVKVKVKVTLRLTVGQSVSLGVEPHPGLMTRDLLLFDSYDLVLWGGGALSDESTGLSFVYAAGPFQLVFLRSESLGTRDHILLSQI
jgi:hypothetical protein